MNSSGLGSSSNSSTSGLLRSLNVTISSVRAAAVVIVASYVADMTGPGRCLRVSGKVRQTGGQVTGKAYDMMVMLCLGQLQANKGTLMVLEDNQPMRWHEL